MPPLDGEAAPGQQRGDPAQARPEPLRVSRPSAIPEGFLQGDLAQAEVEPARRAGSRALHGESALRAAATRSAAKARLEAVAYTASRRNIAREVSPYHTAAFSLDHLIKIGCMEKSIFIY